MKPKLVLSILAVLVLVVAGVTAGCNQAKPRTDAQVASDVQSKIMGDSAVQSKQVSVQANNGVVTLGGTVNSDAERTAAANDAGSVEGVKTVINNLTVQQAQQPASNDQEQTEAENNAPASTRPSARHTERETAKHRERNTDRRNNTASQASSAPSYNSSNNQPAQNQTAQNMTPAAPAPAPVPQGPKKITIPDGTTVSIRLNDPLDSERNQTGDTFRGTLNSPLIVEDNVVVPENADVEGRVTQVQSAGHFQGQSLLSIELTKLSFNGHTYQIHTNQWSKQGTGRGKNTAAKVGGGAALGAIIGGIAGGGKGAAIGAGIGAGAGTGVQAATKGQQIKLNAESLLNFQLQSPVTVVAASELDRSGNRQSMRD